MLKNKVDMTEWLFKNDVHTWSSNACIQVTGFPPSRTFDEAFGHFINDSGAFQIINSESINEAFRHFISRLIESLKIFIRMICKKFSLSHHIGLNKKL